MSELLEKARKFGIWILAPLTFVLGFIYYILTQNRSLKDSLRQAKSNADIQDTLAKKDEAHHEADKANQDWDSVRDQYVNPDGTPKKPS